MAAWHEEPINKKHDREAFDCGEDALNEFLRRYARKSHELGGAKTFLAIDDTDGKTVLGYYSVSPASVEYARTPEIVRRGLAMTCRVSGWHAWLWIEEYRGRVLEGSSCWRRGDAACWQQWKWVAWCLSLMRRIKGWQAGMPATARCPCWTRRYLCSCRW